MKSIIITIRGDAYLIPDDQAKDLTGLVERVSAWQPINRKTYSEKTREVVEPMTEVTVEVVDASVIKAYEPEKEVS